MRLSDGLISIYGVAIVGQSLRHRRISRDRTGIEYCRVHGLRQYDVNDLSNGDGDGRFSDRAI